PHGVAEGSETVEREPGQQRPAGAGGPAGTGPRRGPAGVRTGNQSGGHLMAMAPISPPHAMGSNRTRTIMLQVLGATLPGVALLTWFFGWGTLINILLASGFALVIEALILHLRKRPVMFFLNDGSALVTAWLLALALPPYSPWWLVLVATGFAMVDRKSTRLNSSHVKISYAVFCLE